MTQNRRGNGRHEPGQEVKMETGPRIGGEDGYIQDMRGGKTQDPGHYWPPGILPIDHDHHLPVGGEHVSLVETLRGSN